MKLLLTTATFCWLSLFCAYGSAAPQNAIPIANQLTQEQLLQQQIVILKASLDASQKFNEQILQTVHWSLGSVLTVAALLIGYGWIVNFKIYERDKETLRDDLTKSFKLEIENIIAEREKALNDKITKMADNASNSASRKFQQLEEDNKQFRLDLTRSTVKDLLEKDNYTLAVTHGIKALNQALALDIEHQIMFVLKDLHEAIEKGGKFLPSETVDLTKLLEKVPPQHIIMKNKITTLLSNANLI